MHSALTSLQQLRVAFAAFMCKGDDERATLLAGSLDELLLLDRFASLPHHELPRARHGPHAAMLPPDGEEREEAEAVRPPFPPSLPRINKFMGSKTQ